MLLSPTMVVPIPAQTAPCRLISLTPANGKMILRWTNGTPPYQVQMQTNRTALWENVGSQTFLCCATNAMSGGMGFFRVICGTNPPPPAVIIAATQPNASIAGPTNGIFRIARSGPTTAAITVPYTITGTAANGIDYIALPGSLTLGAGVASANIAVTPLTAAQPRQRLTVILTIAAPAGFVLGPANSDTVFIANTNVPSLLSPELIIVASRPNASKAGPTNGSFLVARSGPATAAITVPYTITGTASNGVDYVALPGSVTLGAGVASTNIVVAPIPNALVQPTLTLSLNLIAPAGAALGSPSGATVLISNTNVPPPLPPTLSIVATQPNASKAGPINGLFSVSRIGSTAAALTVPYTITGTAENGVDYVALPGSVTLGAGMTSADIVVAPIPDPLVKPALTVSLAITAPPGAVLGAPSYDTVSIANTNVFNPVPPTGGPPRMVGFLPAIGISWDVAVRGSVAYVATDKWGLSLVDVRNQGAPTILGSSPFSFDGKHVAVSGSLAVATGSRSFYPTNSTVLSTVSGLYILNVAVPTNVTLLAAMETNAIAYLDVAISGNYAVVARGPIGLQIFDISNPATPSLVRTVALGGTVWAVTVMGSYAYVANGQAGLQIVNIANPSAPVVVGSVLTPGGAGMVAVEGTLACVGAGDGLNMIDISNPSAPSILGNAPATAYSLKLQNRIVYVAAGGPGLVLIDVHNPAAPTQLGSLLPNVGQYAQTHGVAVSGSTAYVANYDGGLGIIGVSIPPTGPATLSNIGNFSEWFAATSVGAKRGLAVVTGARHRDGGGSSINGLRVIDTQNPASPRVVGSLDSSTMGFGGVAVSGDFAFVACGGAKLQIINISNPANPTNVASCNTPGWANSVTVLGRYAYVANGSQGLSIVDVNDPTAPVILGWVDTPGTARAVAVVGTFAYVADYNYLQIVDVSNPTAPVIRGSIAVRALAVKVQDGTAYVAAAGTGLVIIDVRNPATPTLLATLPPTGGSHASTQGLSVMGDTAYLATTDGGLAVVDVSHPASPWLRSMVRTTGYPGEVVVDGNWACLSDDLAGVNTINLAP